MKTEIIKTKLILSSHAYYNRGAMAGNDSITETCDLDLLNDLHDVIYKRLRHIDNEITLNGYLTTLETDQLNKEVNKLTKCLQVINKLLKITEL